MLALSRPKIPVPPTVQSVTIPAPVGGLNTIAAGADMPVSDAIILNNMVAAEYGLRTRLGWKEWVTGMTGVSVNEVRSVLPFTGSAAAGTNDKIFATTTDGIWDCTSSTQAPSKSVTFGTKTGLAGYCVSTVFVNANGQHFLLVCDEVNGYYVYTESTATWTHVSQQSTTAWAQSTGYTVNVSYVFANGASYLCKTTGTSAATGTGPSGTGTGIADGTCTWDYTPAIGGKDPGTFVFVTVWGNRVWFVERDTGNAWYTGIGSLFGTVTQFPFGARFRAGGDLRGLYNWTRDGSMGSINSLVGISGGGDLVIYEGTDPASIASFGLKGVWSLGGGGVPLGRRLATDFGGDLLVLTTVGVLPLSTLVVGQSVLERSPYLTAKVSNLFNQYMAAARTSKGWQARVHPQDNTLMINVPASDGTTSQLVMNLTTKGWSIYPDMPAMLSMESWGGNLYFGTTDGRLCINTGYLDAVKLASPTAYTPIQWEVLTSFQNGGSQNFKRAMQARISFLSEGGNPGVSVAARFDYDLTELATVTINPGNSTNVWDTGKWDTAVWGGSYSPTVVTRGLTGCGVFVAIIVRGTATSRTSLTGIDCFYDIGGPV